MSRSGDADYEESFPNEYAFWQQRVAQVMAGRRARKALIELREALLALPEKRLISRALSTVGKANDGPDPWGERTEILTEEGEGVCAVGAFAWWQQVKNGADPDEGLRNLPLNPDYDGDPHVTIETGVKAGLGETLAWVLMSRNDDTFEGMTPEERYEAFLAWIDEKLAPAADV